MRAWLDKLSQNALDSSEDVCSFKTVRKRHDMADGLIQLGG